MTVAVPTSYQYTVSVVGGIKQLNRRRLPTRARLTDNSTHEISGHKPTISKNQLKKNNKPSRLSRLRQSYSRRGVVSPPAIVSPNKEPSPIREVAAVCLSGAKRRYVEIDVPSDCDYHSDSSDTVVSYSSSSSMIGGSNHNCNQKSSPRVKFVQFASHCIVVDIPHFREYSPDQKAAIWNGSKKIRSMARKNTIEFQYDGWNVDTAKEEDQFIVVSGTPVHPAHLAENKDSEQYDISLH